MRASSRNAAGASTPVWTAATLVGVHSCPLRRSPACCISLQQLQVWVSTVISSDGAAVTAAQVLNLRCRCTRCICSCCCLHLRSGCCQLRLGQPRRPRCCCSGRCRCSPALLCCSEVGLLPTPRARGARVLRLPFCGHGALLRGEQRQPEQLLLPAGAAARQGARLEKGLSRKCLGYRILRL